MSLATDKQLSYLTFLAKKVSRMVKQHPEAFKNTQLPEVRDWWVERSHGMTTFDASIRINAYRSIIRHINATYLFLGYSQF